MASGVTSTQTELDSAVEKGKAFVIATIRSNNYRPSRSCVQVFLDYEGETDDFDSLTFSRSYGTDTAVTIDWQVIESDDLTVQYLFANMDASTEEDFEISTVDLSKAFLIVNYRTTSTSSGAFSRARFTSTTNVRINNNLANTWQRVHVQVIEWDGASVQSGSAELKSSLETVSLDSDTPEDRTFFFFSHTRQLNSTIPRRAFVYMEYIEADSVRFRTVGSFSTIIDVDWFAITLPGIRTEKASNVSTGTSKEETIPKIYESNSFIPKGILGDSASSSSSTSSLHYGYTTYKFKDDETVRAERGTSGDTFYNGFMVVSIPDGVPGITLNDALNIAEEQADLKATISDDKKDRCQVRFRYRIKLTSEWTEATDSEAEPLYTSDESIITIEELSPGTEYEFQAQAWNSAGDSAWTASKYFTTLAPATRWSHQDTTMKSAIMKVRKGASWVEPVTKKRVGSSWIEY